MQLTNAERVRHIEKMRWGGRICSGPVEYVNDPVGRLVDVDQPGQRPGFAGPTGLEEGRAGILDDINGDDGAANYSSTNPIY